MITRAAKKNNFGGHTWEFKIDSLLHVFMNETDNGTFVIEFKEWKLFNYKIHFSFVTQSDLKGAVVEAINKIYEYLLTSGKYSFSSEQKNEKINDLLRFIQLYNLDT
ncbi:MAG: hypothetical protein FGM14_14945 [Flavobacteriales bacterium]|nr:hypothetical protein [Flavobacteriales bacterium]